MSCFLPEHLFESKPAEEMGRNTKTSSNAPLGASVHESSYFPPDGSHQTGLDVTTEGSPNQRPHPRDTPTRRHLSCPWAIQDDMQLVGHCASPKKFSRRFMSRTSNSTPAGVGLSTRDWGGAIWGSRQLTEYPTTDRPIRQEARAKKGYSGSCTHETMGPFGNIISLVLCLVVRY
ncbi:hypothetical protein LZ31DRAFT_347674 [Colletotrichum somersetense]|nr:hypothetical protein LZ31DRAFT_347674 [Colletotrichum somersetense]